MTEQQKAEQDDTRVEDSQYAERSGTASSNEASCPTLDERLAMMQAHVDAVLNAPPRPRVKSPTRLSYWFPLIEAAGLPVPATRFVRLSDEDVRDLYSLFDGETPACFERVVRDVREAAEGFGVPFFLRTDFTSGKHEWSDTCYVADMARVGHHVAALAEFSVIADMFGGMPFDVFVVRELLKTSPAFHAFRGMPITREFRFFVRNGTIEHWQPYWPPAAFDGHEPAEPYWRSRLEQMSEMSGPTFETLTDLTKQASAAVPGFWSVDWLHTIDRGWVLTDMAEGDKSFRWE
jgi:hypothetical protein